jgi:hypothetical protein
MLCGGFLEVAIKENNSQDLNALFFEIALQPFQQFVLR